MSDSPLTCTGYSNVTQSFCNLMQKKPFYDVHCIGHNYIGQTLLPPIKFEDNSTLDFTLWGAGRQQYCQDIIEHRIRELKADVFWTLLDSFMLFPWIMQKNFAPAKSIMYFPTDGGGTLPANNEKFNCSDVLRKYDVQVAMSQFGQAQCKDVHGLKVEYIPHAVHTNIYYPLSPAEKEKLRQEATVFNCDGQPIKGGLVGKFVIGSVFRNQGRKMADKMIKTLKVLKDNEEKNWVFLAHCDPDDAAAVNDLRCLAARMGVKHKVFFTGTRYYKGFPISQMNSVYNIMDVFFLSTSGEGFGIPTLEAASAGIPSVVTDYTTTPELLVKDGKCGEPVRLVGTEEMSMTEMWLDQGLNMKQIDDKLINGTLTGTWCVERGLMDVHHADECITKIKNSPELWQKYSLAGRQKALKIYDWKIVGEQWNNLIWDLIKK